MTDADRLNEILHRILKAIEPDQRQGGSFEHILLALQAAFTIQMALVHPDCRKSITRAVRRPSGDAQYGHPILTRVAGQVRRTALSTLSLDEVVTMRRLVGRSKSNSAASTATRS